MKIFSLLWMQGGANASIAECRAKDENEAIIIFRSVFPWLNPNGYFKWENGISYCVGYNYGT